MKGELPIMFCVCVWVPKIFVFCPLGLRLGVEFWIAVFDRIILFVDRTKNLPMGPYS
jgi:hypothetical protein